MITFLSLRHIFKSEVCANHHGFFISKTFNVHLNFFSSFNLFYMNIDSSCCIIRSKLSDFLYRIETIKEEAYLCSCLIVCTFSSNLQICFKNQPLPLSTTFLLFEDILLRTAFGFTPKKNLKFTNKLISLIFEIKSPIIFLMLIEYIQYDHKVQEVPMIEQKLGRTERTLLQKYC